MYFPKTFIPAISMELGELVLQAYEQFLCFDEDRVWVPPLGYQLVSEIKYYGNPWAKLEKTIKKYDECKLVPIGFIAQQYKNTYVIFRGTKTNKEWMNNFNAKLKGYLLPDFGAVHEGFFQVYQNIRQILVESLEKTGRGNKLFVAGHSLGAALATIALPDIELNLKKRVSALYTFGSPRVGNQAFVNAFNGLFADRSFRMVNTSDLITSIPPPVPLGGLIGGYFSHVDTPVDFTLQTEEIDLNHRMQSYLEALVPYRKPQGLMQRMLGRIFQRQSGAGPS